MSFITYRRCRIRLPAVQERAVPAKADDNIITKKWLFIFSRLDTFQKRQVFVWKGLFYLKII